MNWLPPSASLDSPCPVCRGSSRQQARITGVDGGLYDILLCAACGLTFAHFLNKSVIPYEDVYNEDFYEAGGRTLRVRYEREGRVIERELAFVRTYIERGRVLDVGSGDGVHVRLLREAGWEAYGIDVSPVAVDYARRQWGVETLCCSLEQAPFLPESFDLIQMRYVLEHLVDPRPVIRAAWTLLRPGGLLRLDAPGKGLADRFQGFVNDRVLPWTRVIGWHHKRSAGPSWGNLHPPEHNLWFTHKALTTLLEAESFHVLRLLRPHRGDRDYFPDWPFLHQKTLKGKVEYFVVYLVDYLGARFNNGNLLVAYAQKPIV